MADPRADSAPRDPAIGQALLNRHRGRIFGVEKAGLIRGFFQVNAAVAILVLGLITFTLFRDAVGFIPANQRNLEVYRLGGLEYVDLLRLKLREQTALSRFLTEIRLAKVRDLISAGVTPAEANRRLAPFDAYANRFDDSARDHQDLLSEMTGIATSLKERYKIAQDMRQVREDYLRAIPRAPPDRARELQRLADAVTVEPVDFTTGVQALRDLFPRLQEANRKLTVTLNQLATEKPALADVELEAKLTRFQGLLTDYLASLPRVEAQMQAWRQDKPVRWWQSLNAFAFGRDWVTASFWQDWYGILPLFTGSFLIASFALTLAIPFGVCAAIYVNQVATPAEQQVIKPTLEFIAAIPSVVLGFFGIAVLGTFLREFSQAEWVQWVPGFPMRERLTAFTAAVLLAFMAIPTIFSLAEDAINNVPRAYKEASFALGATRLQTIVRIIIPTSLSGIFAAILLGLGRVIGETMVVLLCAGNRIEIPDLSLGVGAWFQPVHTMTGIIAQEMGEVVRGSIHYRALFMVGCVLFILSLAINWSAQRIVSRYRLSVG